MSEILEVYNLDSEPIGNQDRAEYYNEIKEEFKRTGKITKKIKSIRLILLNSSGGIYLQKRSKNKKENPGLYDKTIGGHVKAGDSYDLTLTKECAEELGFPITILGSEEFEDAIKNTDITVVGLAKELEYNPSFDSIRTQEGAEDFTMPFMTMFYIGYYDGTIKFSDGESSGIEIVSLAELKEEISQYPNKFTEDIKYITKRFGEQLNPIKNTH